MEDDVTNSQIPFSDYPTSYFANLSSLTNCFVFCVVLSELNPWLNHAPFVGFHIVCRQ